MESKDNENFEEIKQDNIEKINEEKVQIEEVQKVEQAPKKEKSKGNPILGALKRIIIVSILLVVSIFVLDTSKYYKNDDITDKTNVIINNNNVTSRLKQDIIIEDGDIYMSMSDIQNFFDNYIYEETVQDRIITTYDENIAEVYFSGNHMTVNNKLERVNAVAMKKDEVIYLPISEMTNVYNIELKYIEETNIITMDSIKREQVTAKANKKISIKDYARTLSRTVDKVEAGETLMIMVGPK